MQECVQILLEECEVFCDKHEQEIYNGELMLKNMSIVTKVASTAKTLG